MGRLTKIEENYGLNLGIAGLKLLQEHVADPEISRLEKLTVLQPYLTRLMPVMIEIEGNRISDADRQTIIDATRVIASLENSGDSQKRS